jgi:hypothetical protein
LGYPGYLCSKSPFYYGGAKCKEKSKGKQQSGSARKMEPGAKKIFKIVAIEATSKYNLGFVSIFRKDVVIFAILICF